jgi:probable HAF family extracellular repeat protein
VVGSSWYPTGPYSLSVDRATLWRNGGTEIVDLGQTPGPAACADGGPYPDNIALAVNNHGQIVGHAQCIASGGSLAGFLWQDGTMYNLNHLIPPGSGWDLIKATDINDAGQIVGFGLAPGGEYLRAFLLVPADTPVNVPEAVASNRFGLNVSPIPLGPTTQVSYVLQDPGPVRITVHDVAGRRVATLLDRFQPAGHHSLLWSPNGPGGETFGNKVYLLRVTSNGGTAVKKLVYLGR